MTKRRTFNTTDSSKELGEKVCPVCRGACSVMVGDEWDYDFVDCKKCGGSGSIPTERKE